MHVDDMTGAVSSFLLDCNTLQIQKNRDYHPDKIAYLEILQTAFETGVTVEQDLWGRVRKQLSALRRYVIDGHTESEPPRSRMTDVAVYMGMMAVWDAHKRQIVADAHSWVLFNRKCEFHPNDPDPHQTCVYMGVPIVAMCDRCGFVQWLMQYADRIVRAPQVSTR